MNMAELSYEEWCPQYILYFPEKVVVGRVTNHVDNLWELTERQLKLHDLPLIVSYNGSENSGQDKNLSILQF